MLYIYHMITISAGKTVYSTVHAYCVDCLIVIDVVNDNKLTGNLFTAVIHDSPFPNIPGRTGQF